MFGHPMDVQMMSSKGSSTSSYLSVLTLFEHLMDVQDMSSKWSSTSSYLTVTKPVWTPHGRPKYVLKMIVYQFLFGWTNPVWTPQGRANDVLKGIACQFLFDWHNICLNIPWTSKWCPQRDRLPVTIWLTQHLFEHPMDVQMMSSKGSSTSSNLTNKKPVWTPQGHAKDILKGIVYQFLFDWHNICLNTPWTSKWCPQRDRLPVPIWVSQPYLNTPWTCNRCPQSDRLPVPIWLQNLFGHPMDVQNMSSKWSSTSSYLAEPTLFEHHNDVQTMSSKGSPASSYLTDTTSVWTPHGRQNDVLKGIVFQFLFDWHNTCLNTPWTSKWCPQRDPLQVPIWVSQPYLNTPWTCNRCPQSDRLPVPIWLIQHLLEHPMGVQMMSSKRSSTSSYLGVPTLFEPLMDVQKMSSKGSSTSSYLADTTPAWTPHERPKDVLKVIVYQFLFDWHNICLNTPWTFKWCPQRDRLPVPIWLTQHLLEHPMAVQMMSSKRSSTSSYLSAPSLFVHPMDVQKMSSKWSSTSSYLTDTTPAWTPHERAKDVFKMIVYLFLCD